MQHSPSTTRSLSGKPYTKLIVALFVCIALFLTNISQAAFADSVTFHHMQSDSSSCLQPPQGVDPSTLTGQQLAAYGMPPHMPGQSQVQWEYLAKRVKHHYCTGTPTHNSGSGQAWSGYVATNGDRGSNFNYAYTYFRVPYTYGWTAGMAFEWVGMGGWGNKYLVQTGVVENAVGNGTTIYQAVVENFGASNPNWIVMFTMSGYGDLIYADVWGGNCMYIQDVGSGQSSGDQCFGPNANAKQAECIMEDPNYEGQLLADFHSLTFTNCDADGSGIESWSPIKVTMTDNIGNKMDSVGSVSGDGNFSVTWLRYN